MSRITSRTPPTNKLWPKYPQLLSMSTINNNKMLPWDKPLSEADPEVFDIIEKEKCRQWGGLELIASENYTSRAVLECLGSALTNKYSEGYPGARYYGGTEYCDEIESLCQRRALHAFGLNPEEWGVNVQAYSGSPANFAVYTAILNPHDRIMGLGLSSGGHLTHGHYTPKKKISSSSIYFESLPYTVYQDTGLINYTELERMANTFMPKLIICGASAYARDYDYEKLRQIANGVGAYLMADIAHTAGLVATGVNKSPFPHVDIVTTTTHKTLRGPRGALIFFRKQFEEKINFSVFPTLQGGPHNNNIAGIATQMAQVASQEYKEYAQRVARNARVLADKLIEHGYTLVTGGTENHLVLWDLRPQGLTGNKIQKLCDAVAITLNKNAVPGDLTPATPGGVRVGAPAMTSRGCTEEDFVKVAEFLHEVIQIALEIQETSGKKLSDFLDAIPNNAKVQDLKRRVFEWSTQFPIPGFNPADNKFKTLQ